MSCGLVPLGRGLAPDGLSNGLRSGRGGVPSSSTADCRDDLFPWGLLGAHGGFGMSPTAILTLAEDLEADDFMASN